MEEARCILFCMHCGNNAPHKIVFQKDFVSDYIEDEDECLRTPVAWGVDYLVECQTCSRLSFYENLDCDLANLANSFYTSKLVWPVANIEVFSSEVPKSILSIYSEASRIKFLAPNAFAVMIRRALEAVCLDQGVTKHTTLHKSLQELAKQGKLPPLLGEVTDVIKTIGNAGAHAISPPIFNYHVSVIDDFFRVIMEFLYIAPNKLKKFKEEAEKYKLHNK